MISTERTGVIRLPRRAILCYAGRSQHSARDVLLDRTQKESYAEADRFWNPRNSGHRYPDTPRLREQKFRP